MLSQLNAFADTLSDQQQKIRLIYDEAGNIELSAQAYTAPEGVLHIKLIEQSIDDFPQEQFEHKFVDSPLREFYKACSTVGFYDCLFINKDGIITEGARCNFYIEHKGQLIASPVSTGLLPGTYRELIIKEGCIVKPITITMLKEADQCFISNALIGKRKVMLCSRSIHYK